MTMKVLHDVDWKLRELPKSFGWCKLADSGQHATSDDYFKRCVICWEELVRRR